MWVSPQEIQQAQPFVLSFRGRVLPDGLWRPPILRSHQLEPQIVAGSMELPKGTQGTQTVLRSHGTHSWSGLGSSLSRGISANSSDSSLVSKACVHTEKGRCSCRPSWNCVMMSLLKKKLAKVNWYHKEWQTGFHSQDVARVGKFTQTEKGREIAWS